MSEHFELIRKSPEYRNFLMLEEMRAEMQPPLVSPIGESRSINETRAQETEWSRRQWDAVNQLRGLTLHLQKTVNELKQKSTPKGKREPKY